MAHDRGRRKGFRGSGPITIDFSSKFRSGSLVFYEFLAYIDDSLA